MGRIRTIKPDAFTSEDFTSLTPLARLFYVSLWCEADRRGRLKWNLKTLKQRYLPADDCDIEELAKELIKREHIVLYTVDGKDYAWLPTFEIHQSINNKERESVLPPHTPLERKGKERKGKEAASNTRLSRVKGDLSLSQLEQFERWYTSYPNKKARGDAEKAWKRLNPNQELTGRMVRAVGNQKEFRAIAIANRDFVPDWPFPATWLNGRRWEDETIAQEKDEPIRDWAGEVLNGE